MNLPFPGGVFSQSEPSAAFHQRAEICLTGSMTCRNCVVEQTPFEKTNIGSTRQQCNKGNGMYGMSECSLGDRLENGRDLGVQVARSRGGSVGMIIAEAST